MAEPPNTLNDSDGDPLLGSLIDHRYRVLGRIGDGGMGIVYRVEDNAHHATQVIKVMRPTRDVIARLRFEQEARLATTIRHPNVAEVRDFGVLPTGQPYYVMEYLPGPTLGQALAEGRLTPLLACHIALQIAEGLGAIHRQGVVHRDLKPDNIILLYPDQLEAPGAGASEADSPAAIPLVKILDFGIAKSIDNKLTGTGMTLGTPEYMSPEQATGERLDWRSDQYSLGCILYELLTGELPFSGKTAFEVMNKHLTASPVPLRQRRPEIAAFLPDVLEGTVLHMLLKRPAQRYRSIRLLIESLHNCIGVLEKLPGQPRLQFTGAHYVTEPPIATLSTSLRRTPTPRLVERFGTDPTAVITDLARLIPWWLHRQYQTHFQQGGNGRGGAWPFLSRIFRPNRGRAERAFAQLDRGWFGVDAPRQMQLGQTSQLSAIAVRSHLMRALVENELKQDNTRIEEMPLSDQIHVELVADRPEDFTIVPLTEPEQPVLIDQTTVWEWSVTPHRCGPGQILRMRVSYCVEVGHKTLRKSQRGRTVVVEVVVLAVDPLRSLSVELIDLSTANSRSAPVELPTHTLRQLLDEILRADSDVDAFCLDFFPTVYRRFSLGMERTHKLTLLLLHVPATDLLHRIGASHPRSVQRMLDELRTQDVHTPALPPPPSPALLGESPAFQSPRSLAPPVSQQAEPPPRLATSTSMGSPSRTLSIAISLIVFVVGCLLTLRGCLR